MNPQASIHAFIGRCFLLILLCLFIVGLQSCVGDPNKPYYGNYHQ